MSVGSKSREETDSGVFAIELRPFTSLTYNGWTQMHIMLLRVQQLEKMYVGTNFTCGFSRIKNRIFNTKIPIESRMNGALFRKGNEVSWGGIRVLYLGVEFQVLVSLRVLQHGLQPLKKRI